MSPETLILAALSIPLAGALLIGLTGRVSPNLREIVTLTTAGLLIFCVWSLLPFVYQGGRPGVQLAEVLP
ncbi:MAG: monovalent cation/H+ antiporter subunit D family protein, partial [Xanthomonadales bacterium]|nr:monovalent cation/H+ antiporter subunit D family protein [Xanthomonadales bacterium]